LGLEGLELLFDRQRLPCERLRPSDRQQPCWGSGLTADARCLDKPPKSA
jgi:hypothetical protein